MKLLDQPIRVRHLAWLIWLAWLMNMPDWAKGFPGVLVGVAIFGVVWVIVSGSSEANAKTGKQT